ncbi:MAG: tripartite tricarboxylate transporter substrate-binding protein [Betaproteobacteria bacterium]
MLVFNLLRNALVAALLMSCASFAIAQSSTIRIIVGFPPGATSDTLTRVLAEGMSKRLNQPVIVENRAGAAGQLANIALKNAAPDGTTLMMTPVATMSIYPHSYGAQLRYDPFKDFVPVAHLTNFQIGLGVGVQVKLLLKLMMGNCASPGAVSPRREARDQPAQLSISV